MRRRTVLKLASLTALAASGAKVAEAGDPAWSRVSRTGRLFIPGYWPESAGYRGTKSTSDRAFGANVRTDDAGKLSLLTRIDSDGSVRQALFPVKGHDVAITTDARLGFFGRMGFGPETRAAHHASFDVETLEMVGSGKPLKPGWRGGGHGVFLAGGTVLVTAERAPVAAYGGRKERHFGCLAFRDPQTLTVLDSISCHGIDPHEIRLLPGERLAAVANYGSIAAPGQKKLGVPRTVIEASVTVVDLASGRLVWKFVSSDPETELRHIATGDHEQLLAIRARLGEKGADAGYFRDSEAAYEADRSADADEAYLAASPLLIDMRTEMGAACGDDRAMAQMRHGLSVEHDPLHREFIATFPSSHQIMTFDDGTGELKLMFDSAAAGLRYPSGLAILPGDTLYAVAGYWENLFIYERGTHRLVRELCLYPTLFGHSHITAA